MQPGWLGANQSIFSRIYDKPISIVQVASLLLGLFVVAVGIDVLFDFDTLRALLGFGIFVTVPGALIITLLGYEMRSKSAWLLYAVGTSLLAVMGVGFVLNLVLPAFGVERPLSPIFLGAAHTGLILGLSIAVRAKKGSDTASFSLTNERVSAWAENWITPTTLAILLLTPATILSVYWLNLTADNRPLVAVLIAIALLPVAVATRRVDRRLLPITVLASGLSLLYHDSLWAFSRFSGQKNIIDAWQTGSWSIAGRGAEIGATTPLLPNVTLSPTFAHLAGVNIFTQLEVFNPLFVVFIPLGSFVIFRRFIEPEYAALAAFLVMFIHPFYFQLPTGGRAATPVLFLVLTTAAITDTDMNPLMRQALALAFAAGLVTSHYGGSYFAMAGFVFAILLLTGMRLLDRSLLASVEQQVTSDGGKPVSRIRAAVRSNQSVFSLRFVFFYIAMTFGWYLYTFDGKKFRTFFSRVQNALVSFLDGSVGGGTTARLTREYGIVSVQLSRVLYLGLALLTVVGVCYLFIQRFTGDEWRMKDGFDEYYSLAVGVLAVFSLTLVFDAIWGGGRPMAITFGVTALFAVVGTYAIVEGIQSRGLNFDRYTREDSTSTHQVAGVIFATILTVLLLLNTGVAAAAVLGGAAPSEVPLHKQMVEDDSRAVYFEQDVSAYVWMSNNGGRSTVTFGDVVTRAAARDWYGPYVAVRDGPSSVSISYDSDVSSVVGYRGDAYVVLSSHNVVQDTMVLPGGPNHRGARSGVNIDKVRDTLSGQINCMIPGSVEYTS